MIDPMIGFAMCSGLPKSRSTRNNIVCSGNERTDRTPCRSSLRCHASRELKRVVEDRRAFDQMEEEAADEGLFGRHPHEGDEVVFDEHSADIRTTADLDHCADDFRHSVNDENDCDRTRVFERRHRPD